jgi:hypothetical protein
MLAELLKHVPANVKTVQAAFEHLRPGESYGLVYAPPIWADSAVLCWTHWPHRSRSFCALVMCQPI